MWSSSRLMATQEPRGNTGLQSFVLPDARVTGKRLGEGPYGCVEVLEVSGLYCAGKSFREDLMDSRKKNDVIKRTVEERYDACARFLSDLRHPNIVQFLGICFPGDQSGPPRPMLVTERLQSSLDDLLESTRGTIPLTKKCSILRDVARGLVYLHGRSPALVHKDLTAKNVLLNSAMVAKIGDVGNSHMLGDEPEQLANVMTSEMRVHMPPEVFENPPKYGPELDMFSFGHLTLFTVIQVFPDKLQSLPEGEHDEVVKRMKYMDAMKREIGVSHELVQLSTQCLEYAPDARPSASDVLQRIQNISCQVANHYHSMPRLQLQKLVKEKELQLQEEKEEKKRVLQEENVKLEEQIALLEEQLKPPQVQEPEKEQNHSEDSHLNTTECDMSSWDIVDISELQSGIIKEVHLQAAPSKQPISTQTPSNTSVSTEAAPKEPPSTKTSSSERVLLSKTPSSGPEISRQTTSTKTLTNEAETSRHVSSATDAPSNGLTPTKTTSKESEMSSKNPSSSEKLSKEPVAAKPLSKVSETPSKEPVSANAQPKKPVSTKAPSKESASSKTPSKESASTKTPSKESASSKAPSKESASSKTPSKDSASSKAPSKESSSSKTPSKESASSKAPSKGSASSKAPSKESASSKTPSKESASSKAPKEPAASAAKKGKKPENDRKMKESSARSTVVPSKAPTPTKTASKGAKTPFTKSASTGDSLKAVTNPRGSFSGGYGGDQYEGRYGGYGRGGGGYLEDGFGGSYGGGRGGGYGYGGGSGGGYGYGGGSGDGYGGSPYGVGGRKHNNDELRLRMQVANRRMEESSERAVSVLSDTLQLGKKTGVELDRQAEALGRTERRLDEMDQHLRPKQSKSSFGSGPMHNGSFRRPETAPPPSLAHFPSTGNTAVDKNLDILSEGLHELKQVAGLIGEQLDHTTAQAGRVQYKSHQTDMKMKEVNKHMREQLNQPGKRHQTNVKIKGDTKRHL